MGGKIEHMDGKVDRVEGYVGDIRGLHYEQYCIATVNAALSRRLRRARLVERDSIADHLDDALDSGAIDYRQHHAATVTDIIVQGFCRRRQAMVKVAVEVSIRLNRHDIDRASERAGILSLATGETFVAYCVGHRQWSEQLERYADEMDVAIVHYPWENLDSPPIDNE